MPEIDEVFRLATNKVEPAPHALERQHNKQRSAARKDRIRAYVAVAAVLAVLAVAAVAVFDSVSDGSDVPAVTPTITPAELTFVTDVPESAIRQTAVVVDLNGHVASKLSGLPVDAYGASVSANGSAIAFVTAPQELDYNQIGLLDTATGQAHILPTLGNFVETVAVSPDGSHIAFSGFADFNTDIFVIGSDGTGLRRLTDDPAADQYPQWSPDGKTIVYDNAGARQEQDAQFSSTAEIWTVRSDGSAPPTQLTDNHVPDSSPSFSPTGQQVAYFHDGEIWLMSADGSDQHPLLDGDAGGFTPRWSPDGRRIAFTTYSDAYAPEVQMGDQFVPRPLVILRVVDVASGRVTTFSDAGMATDQNTPQWTDNAHILIIRVPVEAPA
jgi:Tol biopolymer transport system component